MAAVVLCTETGMHAAQRLYELIFDFAWAAVLVWLGHHGLRHRKIKPPGLFALYVFGYSAYRIFEESLRIDSSVYFLGLRLNTYIASALAVIGLVWFWRIQRRPDPEPAPDPAPDAAADTADPDVPAGAATDSDPGSAPAHAGAPASASAGAPASASPPASAPAPSQEPQQPQESHDSESAHG